MASEGTHGNVVQAAGATTVAETLIGLIELPKRAEDWVLHNIMGQVCQGVADVALCTGGVIRMESPSGDVTPDPGPSRWPVYSQGSHLGATVGANSCALHRYDINLLASGKANINLNSINAIAQTTAPRWTGGLSYGPKVPEIIRAKFCDRVRGTQLLAPRTALGTIPLSEKATRIVGIFGSLKQSGVLTTAEELTGFFDLSSDDVDLAPSQWMFNEVSGAGIGALIQGAPALIPQVHRVDIPVIGGADIDVFVTLGVAVTNAANVDIFILYE
jgi:hypothetical protein